MKKFIYSAGLLAMAPAIAFAQYQVQTGFIDSLILLIKNIISFAFPALSAIAVIIFIYSVIRFILEDKLEEKEKRKKGIIYSLAGLIIIFALFGIIRVVQNITGTGGNNTIDSSQVPRVDLSF